MLPTIEQLENIRPGQQYIYRVGGVTEATPPAGSLQAKAMEMYDRGKAILFQVNIRPALQNGTYEYYIVGVQYKPRLLLPERKKRKYVSSPRKIPENVRSQLGRL